jgi:glucuronate isomerase
MWVQQFHVGAIRNNNAILQDIGPDQGFDSIGDLNRDNGSIFGRLSECDGLANTISII